MSAMPVNPDKRPWYKEPMVWMVILLPLSVVIAGISTVVIASRNADSLVVDGFQRVGLMSSRVSAADIEASRLGIRAMVRIDQDSLEMKASVQANGRENWQGKLLKATLHHPTRSENDFEITLQREDDGLFSATLPRDIASGWYLQLETPDNSWRLSGQFNDARLLRLTSRPL